MTDICAKYQISDRGGLSNGHLLDMETARDLLAGSVLFSHKTFTNDPLVSFGLSECRPRAKPMDATLSLRPSPYASPPLAEHTHNVQLSRAHGLTQLPCDQGALRHRLFRRRPLPLLYEHDEMYGQVTVTQVSSYIGIAVTHP
jgi:hypothetical protein